MREITVEREHAEHTSQFLGPYGPHPQIPNTTVTPSLSLIGKRMPNLGFLLDLSQNSRKQFQSWTSVL